MMKSTLLASALALATAIPAGATSIDVGLGTGTGSISTVATGTGSTGASWTGSYDNYVFNVIQASDPVPIGLGSGTLDVTLPAARGGATAPVYVYVTETGLTSTKSTLNFLSKLAVDNLPSGWSETESIYENNSDKAYGMSTLLASMSGSGAKSVTKTGVKVGSPSVGSPFSLTEVYEIASNGFAGSGASSEYVRSVQPAPAPLIGSGIPAMLAVGGVLLGSNLFCVGGNPK